MRKAVIAEYPPTSSTDCFRLGLSEMHDSQSCMYSDNKTDSIKFKIYVYYAGFSSKTQEPKTKLYTHTKVTSLSLLMTQ